MNHLPPIPENNINVISHFSKIRGDIAPQESMTLVANLPQSSTPAANWWQHASGTNYTSGKFCHWCHCSVDNDTASKSPPVLKKSAANLPQVSTTPMANNGYNIRLLTPLGEIEGKIYLHVSSTTHRCPNKTIETFRIEDFFHFATGVSNNGCAP
jgi:hypothetical protein